MQPLRLFLTAVQFFTRLPVPGWVGHSAGQLEQAARYLPLVGIVVGAISAGVLWATAQVLPLPLAIALSIAAGILVTGAFHEDGLSDFADGFGSEHTPEKILSIMKDSRVGAYGVIALVLVLLMKFEALLSLSQTYALPTVAAALVAAHAVSRLLAVSLMYTQHYVRTDDSARAKPVSQAMSTGSFIVALLGAAITLPLLPMDGIPLGNLASAVIAALSMRVWLAWRIQQRLGGYTGDCLGAVQQLSEIAFYFGLLVAF
ncbi:MAG: adenosylcobinamide-GDP ribazoletransferase [Pseudomonadota bacterium]